MTATVLPTYYRSFNPDLQVRASGDGRTVCGIAVPYGAPMRINDNLVEQFARGAFAHQVNAPSRVRFTRDHLPLGGILIGALTTLREDAAGLYMEARVSRTPVGEETLELIKDGALSQLSIFFRARQDRRLAGGVTERVKADLIEVASVLEGAYGELAVATGVRSAGAGELSADDVAARAAAERFLCGSGLPELRDFATEAKAIRLGLR